MRRFDALVLIALTLTAAGCVGDAPVVDAGASPALEPAPAPRTVGVDSALLGAVYDSAARLPRLHSLLVARHGRLYGERYYQGRTAQRTANIKSASKSVVSALVGIAIAEGKLSLDQPIAPFFSQHLAGDTSSLKRTITIENLLSMQAGLESTSSRNYGEWVSSSNWVRYAITRPMVDVPGGRMQYSTGSSHLLSAILTRATGTSTLAYAREKLARPLGIDIPGWTTDPQGIYFGGNEMRMTPRDMLTFGEMYRNGGVHEGVQVVPREWIERSWVPRTVSRFNTHRYGYGWWIRQSGPHPVYFAWGYGGQYIFIVPDLELTMVTTSDPVLPREGDHNRAVHRLLDRVVMAAENGAT
jgi:CubicO group peptidase (beta-lactamase class C family)